MKNNDDDTRMATKTQNHTIGSMEIYEHPEKLFFKHILKEGSGDVTANAGSVCTVYVRLVDYPIEIPEADFAPYVLNEDKEVTVGNGSSFMSELIDQVLITMKEGESAYIKSSKNHLGEKTPELEMKSKGLKLNVILKTLSRAADMEELEADEKFEQAQQRKNAGSELFKENKITYAVKQYNEALKYLDSMGSAEDIPDVLQNETSKLKCQCYLNLGACCLNQKNWEEAISMCDKALELEHNNMKGLYRRGQALTHLDKFAEARVDLQQASKLEPSNKAVMNQLKAVEYKLKQEKDLYKKMFSS